MMIELITVVFAIVYIAVVNLLRDKFGEQKKFKQVSKEMKELTNKLVEAHKRNDKKEIDRLEKQQKELVIRLNKHAIKNLIPTIMVIFVFFGFIYVLDHIDPYKQDDITIILNKSRDEYIGKFYANKTGTWKISMETEKPGDLLFVYDYYEAIPRKEGTDAWLEPNETTKDIEVTIHSPSPGKAKIDMGTRLTVKLPFKIPLLNIDTIYEVNWWFIFVVTIVNLLKGIGEYLLKKVKI